MLKLISNALSFYRSQNVLCQSKNVIAFSASSKTFVPAQKPNSLNRNHFGTRMPCPSTGHKMFCASPIFCARPNIWIVFSATSNSFVPVQKLNFLNGNHLLVSHKKFGTGTIWKSIFGLAQSIWTSPKHFVTYRRTRQ